MRRPNAFTLVELLVVMGVLALLAGITLGVAHGIRGHRKEQQARSELAALTVALESYRAEYGDYPLATGPGGSAENARILAASLGPAGGGGPGFLDRDRFAWDRPGEILLDPWGQPYTYQYDPGWTGRFGFLLYSRGPDGEHEPPSTRGNSDRSAPPNKDNLYP